MDFDFFMVLRFYLHAIGPIIHHPKDLKTTLEVKNHKKPHPYQFSAQSGEKCGFWLFHGSQILPSCHSSHYTSSKGSKNHLGVKKSQKDSSIPIFSQMGEKCGFWLFHGFQILLQIFRCPNITDLFEFDAQIFIF